MSGEQWIEVLTAVAVRWRSRSDQSTAKHGVSARSECSPGTLEPGFVSGYAGLGSNDPEALDVPAEFAEDRLLESGVVSVGTRGSSP